MASSRDEPLLFMNPSSSSPITVSDTDSYLLDSSQIGSASGSFQNEGFLGGSLDGGGDGGVGNIATDFGFYRADFRQNPLAGTVDFYERHVFLCYKNPRVWPPRIEAAEFDRLPRLLSATLCSRKTDMKRQTRLTICEGRDGTETSNGDVLIFPDMVRYRRLTHFDIDTFVDDVLVKDGEWSPGTPEALRDWYIFVCCHGSRDRRCGVCGPALVSKFTEEIELHGLQHKVYVSPCSHIGGHKYAGNVIIFGQSVWKKVTGHWYGYVTPDDVPILLERHIGRGEIVDSLWRGQMGLSEEEQKHSQELRLQLNGGSKAERSIGDFTKTECINANICGSQAEGVGCCQENGSFTCRQNDKSPENGESPHINERAAKSMVEKNRRPGKQISTHTNSRGASSQKVRNMPTWIESWEREDTYAVLSVIAAAASVAFAYNCYKQLN